MTGERCSILCLKHRVRSKETFRTVACVQPVNVRGPARTRAKYDTSEDGRRWTAASRDAPTLRYRRALLGEPNEGATSFRQEEFRAVSAAPWSAGYQRRSGWTRIGRPFENGGFRRGGRGSYVDCRQSELDGLDCSHGTKRNI
jgi:hypothetical protein